MWSRCTYRSYVCVWGGMQRGGRCCMGRLVRLPIWHDWGFIERAVWTGDPTFLLSPIPAGSHKDARP